VPVVNDEGAIVGILCDRDIRTASSATEKRDPSLGELNVADIPVSEIMVAKPVTVTPETEVATALDMMKEKRISCLPVEADGKVVGIITGADFLSLLRRLFDD
jgi:acetoin utilization protein AcuB